MVKESKFVASKPICVFSGHKCSSIPTKSGLCGHMVEQIPPTAMWGKLLLHCTFKIKAGVHS